MNPAHSRRSAENGRGDRMILGLFIAFMVIVAFTGGAARSDVLSVLFPRVAALLFMLWAFIVRPGWNPVTDWRATLFIVALFGIVAVQLIPLPPAIWTTLPGRAIIVDAAALAGVDQPWRPMSLMPGATLNALVALLVPLAAFVGARSLGAGSGQKLLIALLALIIFSGLLGMMQVAGGPQSPLRFYAITNPEHAVGLFANRNHQAFLLVLGFPILFALVSARHRRSGIALVVLAALSLLLLTMIVLTGSRMGAVLGLVAIAVSLFAFPDILKFKRRAARGLAAAFAIVVGLFLSLGLLKSESISRLISEDPAADLRVVLLGDFIKMMQGYFPVGSGFGSFPAVYQIDERVAMLGPKYVNHAHNDLLEVVIEGGAPVVALLLVFLIWWGISAFRIFHSGKDSGPLNARVAVLATGLLLLSCLTDYPLRTPLLGAIFALFCGLIVRHATKTGRTGRSGVDSHSGAP